VTSREPASSQEPVTSEPTVVRDGVSRRTLLRLGAVGGAGVALVGVQGVGRPFLAERGLLTRRREGHVIVYAPSLTEAEYLSRSMEHTLRGASSEARQVAIAQLIGSLPRDEAAELGRLADEVAVERMR